MPTPPVVPSKQKLSRQVTGRKQSDAKQLIPTEEDYARLRTLLNRSWSPFRSLSVKELAKLSESFELLEYQPGDIIMQKGVIGKHLYLIDDGSVELFNVKYGQQPVLITTINVNKNYIHQVLGKLNSRIFGLTALRLAVEQPVGARASLSDKPCAVWRMSADAYDISLQNRDSLKKLFAKYASVPIKTGSSGGEHVPDDQRLNKKMTQADFFKAMVESDPRLDSKDVSNTQTVRSLKALFSIADGDMNDPTGLLSFPEFAALFDLLEHQYASYDIAFRAFDIDRSGYVSKSEFENGIKKRMLRSKTSRRNEETSTSKTSTSTSTSISSEFEFKSTNSDLVRRYLGSKEKGKPLNFGEFSEFFSDLQQEIAAQAFEHASDSDNCITFDDAVPLIRMVAPGHFKEYMQKNLTQLLAMYSGSKINYPTFRAFTKLLEKHQYIEAAIFRQCQKKGRKISRSEFAAATMIEGAEWTVADELTPLQFQIMWDVMSRSRGGEIGVEDLVTKFEWKGTMADINPDQLEQIATPSEKIESGMVDSILHFFQEFVEHFALGAVAGGIGAAAVYPIDLGKTRLQNQVNQSGVKPQYSGTIDAMIKVFKTEGPVGMYRGLFPQLAGVAPEKAIKLTVNDMLRRWFKTWNDDDNDNSISIPLEILVGGGGGMAQVTFTNPMEIVKIRLQMASMNEAGARPSAMSVVNELGFSGLYKGASACFMRDIPFSMIYFPTYATLRAKFQGDKENASASDLFIAVSFFLLFLFHVF